MPFPVSVASRLCAPFIPRSLSLVTTPRRIYQLFTVKLVTRRPSPPFHSSKPASIPVQYQEGLSHLCASAMRKNGLRFRPFTLLIWVAWVKMIKGHVTPWPFVFHSFMYQSVPSTRIFLPAVKTCGWLRKIMISAPLACVVLLG